MKYKTIIWDLDGTLLNSIEDLWYATNHALKTFHLPERTLEEVTRFVGNGVRRLMIQAVPGGEENADFSAIFAEFKRYYVIHCQEHTAPYMGIMDILTDLKSKGIKMAIVSNKLQDGVTELYERWFKDTIDVAIGEREGFRRKPAPDMVELALQELGMEKSDAVYIGDSEVDILTARNSGLDCISVLWGFRKEEELIRNGATTIIGEVNNLYKALQ